MRQTWRWFGPPDIVPLSWVRQAGAEGIVTALHHLPPGIVWPQDEIARRKRDIEAEGLTWDVVESLPVSEDIKAQSVEWRAHIAAYRESLRNLAEAGIEVICYNFMPVLDWTRTNLAWPRPSGATCMRFDLTEFALFDIHVLKRVGAADDYPDDIQRAAERLLTERSAGDLDALAQTVVAGLPGSAETFSLDDVRTLLGRYDGIDADQLRSHLIDFLSEVVPVAEEFGLRLCCHPDDPPFPLLGLPRIMSTEDDYARVMAAVESPANGITLCSGSLGARPDNDLPGMMDRLGGRVHFLHLRNVTRDGPDIRGSFFEDEHLAGGTDMVALIAAVLREEGRRQEAGRHDASIPFRPDHGQDILDDLARSAQPGYPAIGRLKGLAELRGVIAGLSA